MYKDELKKSGEDALKKMYKETELLTKKIKTANKRNPQYPICERFCEQDYRVETDKIFKRSAKKYNIPYKPSSSQEQHFVNNVCKKMFCNTKCDGYDFTFNNKKVNFIKKNTKNGFNKTYKKKMVNGLKKKGALSACIYAKDYNPFHK
jgi:hypothetical protein